MREVRTGQAAAAHVHWQVADGLQRMGVRPGDKVAYIGRGFTFFAFWARLARIQIITDLPARDDFWKAHSSLRNRVIEAFAKTGAKIIVADEVPRWATAEGWQRIGETSHYVYFLPR